MIVIMKSPTTRTESDRPRVWTESAFNYAKSVPSRSKM
ncbi:hypothetical protein SPLC1_S201360 [Arthrospira platensis C1]|nr:hypothetical protein SPLC1_S201360 [Arthrospira platensis C1]